MIVIITIIKAGAISFLPFGNVCECYACSPDGPRQKMLLPPGGTKLNELTGWYGSSLLPSSMPSKLLKLLACHSSTVVPHLTRIIRSRKITIKRKHRKAKIKPQMKRIETRSMRSNGVKTHRPAKICLLYTSPSPRD